MKCNIKGCGKIDGGFEDGICRPCYSFITADQGKEHMSERTKAQDETQIGGSERPSPFGIRLRQFREAKGLTLQQVADAVGCPKAYVWEMEMREGQLFSYFKGDYAKPTADRLNAIAKTLGVKVEDLLGDPIGEVTTATPKDVAFFREYAGMSEDEKKCYRDAMKLIKGTFVVGRLRMAFRIFKKLYITRKRTHERTN
jgi:transcriptional regulator with XRE-family HTH domain